MTIPARPDRDPDLVIAASLRDVPKLAERIAALEKERDEAKREMVEQGGLLTGQMLHDHAARVQAERERDESLAHAALLRTALAHTNAYVRNQAAWSREDAAQNDAARLTQRADAALTATPAQAAAELAALRRVRDVGRAAMCDSSYDLERLRDAIAESDKAREGTP